MDDAQGKPSVNVGRRLRWLSVIVLATIALYGAGWFWLAQTVDDAVERASRQSTQSDVSWQCDGREIVGFPFRIGVSCRSIEATASDGSWQLQGPAMRTAAQVYSPRRMILEVQSPITITEPSDDRTHTIGWDTARGSAVTAPPAERAMSFQTDGLRVDAFGIDAIFAAQDAQLHARTRNADADVAVRARAIQLPPQLIGQRPVPGFGIDIDLTLADFASDWMGATAQGSGTANRVALLATADRGLIVEGPFTLNDEGLLSGAFSVRVVDVPGILEMAGTIFPDYAPALQAIAANQPRQEGMPDDELLLDLTVQDGAVRAGFIPLGRIPPLTLDMLSDL